MSYRTTVTMTDHFKDRVQAYADLHGATISGALVALAARTLDRDEEARAYADVETTRETTR